MFQLNERQSQMLDEILWQLKYKTKQVTALTLSDTVVLQELRDSIVDMIREENIPILFDFMEREKSRFMIVLEVNPMWAFVCKRRNDHWDYMSEIYEIAEVL